MPPILSILRLNWKCGNHRECQFSLVLCSSGQMSYKEKKNFLTCRRLRCPQVLSCGKWNLCRWLEVTRTERTVGSCNFRKSFQKKLIAAPPPSITNSTCTLSPTIFFLFFGKIACMHSGVKSLKVGLCLTFLNACGLENMRLQQTALQKWPHLCMTYDVGVEEALWQWQTDHRPVCQPPWPAAVRQTESAGSSTQSPASCDKVPVWSRLRCSSSNTLATSQLWENYLIHSCCHYYYYYDFTINDYLMGKWIQLSEMRQNLERRVCERASSTN